jgi:hypothetical protein
VLSRLWGWRSKREENEGGDDGEDERKKRKGDENGGGDEDGDEEEKMMKRSRDEEEKLRSFRYDYYVLMNDKKSQYKIYERVMEGSPAAPLTHALSTTAHAAPLLPTDTELAFNPVILLFTAPAVDRFMAALTPRIEDLPRDCPKVSLKDTGLESMDGGTSRFSRLSSSYHPVESVRHINISPTLSPDKRYLRMIIMMHNGKD